MSGTDAREPSGAIAGDVVEQTRRVLQRIGGILAEGGASLERVLAVTVYLKSAADFQAMNDAYRAFWPGEPPTRTTVVADLVDPGALVEMSAIAATSGADRAVVHPSDWIASPNPYSYAIASGDIVLLSGLVSRNGRDNTAVSGDVTTQTRVVLDNAGEILRAAGLDFSNVVSTRVFLPDRSTFQQMNAAYAEYFPSAPPARATVAARLAGSQYLVEMTLTASSAARTIEEGAPAGAKLPLSGAVRAGRRLYLSGVLGFTAANRTDAAAQTTETLSRIVRTLGAAGCSPADVVDATVFLADLNAYAAMDGAYRQFFEGAFPARTTVGTGLVAPGALVEIMMTALAR